MNILITLTYAGSSTGPFNLYSDANGYTTPFETGVSRSSLLLGYETSLVPDSALTIRCQSTGLCTNYIDMAIANRPTPTPTPTIPLTQTVTPTPNATPTNTPTISVTPTKTPAVGVFYYVISRAPQPNWGDDACYTQFTSFYRRSSVPLQTNKWYCDTSGYRCYVRNTVISPGSYTFVTMASGPFNNCLDLSC